MYDMRIILADVKEKIEEKVLHPYLLKFIDSPVIDEDKLLLLISILKEVNLQKDKAENYVLTTMLIQIALDTHELVKNDELEYDRLKNRQLTVLAGVYYSGLYYKILAELDDIVMIRTLAEGIKDVNEHKISLYQKVPKNVDCLMSCIKKIEASLFDKMTEHFEEDNWKELASNLLLIKRLMAEKKGFIEEGTSVVFEALKKLYFPKDEIELKDLSIQQKEYLLITCERYIDFSKVTINKCMKNLPFIDELLKQRIHFIINQHKPMAKTFVEEG